MVKLSSTMFREYDIRGREGEDLNEEVMELLGKAYGTFLQKRGIHDAVVGHDNRETSESYYKAAMRGLLSTGCDIIDVGIILTPMLYWSLYYFKVKGGLCVTASHNPKGWNGVKLTTGYSATTNEAELQEIKGIIESRSFVEETGSMRTDNINEAYMNDLLARVEIDKQFRVLVNTGNGTAGLIVPELLRRAGCDVVEYLTDLDPEYPRYTPNPADIEMMDDTGKQVVAQNTDFGFAFDGDGDRFGLTDEKGQTIWPDRYLILLARLVLEKKPGAKIVFDVKCSQALPEDIKAHGGVPVMWKTGHTYIDEKLHEIHGSLGGELSGHIFFMDNYYGFDDALFAALNMLQYLSTQDKTMSEVIATTPYYVASPAYHPFCPDEKKYEVVDKLTKQFKEEGYEVIDINGARVQFPDGSWGLVRASSNIPSLVLRFEAKTKERLEELEKFFRAKIEQFDFVGKEWPIG